jgi:hypothetical protein
MFRLISMIFIEIPDAFGFIRGFAVAFAGVAVFAVILDMPRHLTVFAGLIGAVGYAAYLIAGMYSKLEVTKVFWAMIVVAFLSHILARCLKAPAAVFSVCGMIPFVPGGAIYRSVLYFIRGQSALSNHYFSETLQIAGSIALAIFIMDSLFKMKQSKK